MNQRIYYLDAMRGVLMMLGVVLHSAQVFNPREEWLFYSQKSTEFAPILIDTIHLFRMPAFFIVSAVEISDTNLESAYKSTEVQGLEIKIEHAPGKKCQRCWNWSEHVGRFQDAGEICERCYNVLFGRE